MAFDKTKLQIY